MMMSKWNMGLAITAFVALLGASAAQGVVHAQEQTAAADAAPVEASPEPLNDDELEILVARIALYPDELIAVISGASLYPLQIVEAARFLDQYEKDKTLKPKESWDGSIVSLLNYPDIVRMMSDDLEWTQSLGDALAYQQKDVLVAIQQLRDEAVAKGIIKTDDKIEVVEEDDNVVIKSASPEVIYVPQYEPEMLYVPDYVPAPIRYYPDPYPYYYNPAATFFAGAVTGAIWGAAVDWNDWGVWGGRWNGGGVDIDCNNCFNNRNFNGKININDVDWKNVDRSKINIDKNQFNKIDRKNISNNIKANGNNSIGNKAANLKKGRPSTLPGKAAGTRDVRKSTLDGLKNKPGNTAMARPDKARPNISKPASKPDVSRPNKGKPVSRPSGPKKPAAKVDRRPQKASGLGHVSKGKSQKISSQRGHKSMGGGHRGGGGHKKVKRSGGRRR
jgi:hypothetical protein